MIVRVVDYDYLFWFEGVPVLGDFGKWAFGSQFASGFESQQRLCDGNTSVASSR